MYVTKVWQGYIIKSAAWLFAKDWEYTASQGVAYDARGATFAYLTSDVYSGYYLLRLYYITAHVGADGKYQKVFILAWSNFAWSIGYYFLY